MRVGVWVFEMECGDGETVYAFSDPEQREEALKAIEEAQTALKNSPELQARAREELARTVDKMQSDDWSVDQTRAGFRLRMLPPKTQGGKLVAGIELSNGEMKEFEQTEEGKKSLWQELMRLEAGSRALDHIDAAKELCERMKEAAKINDQDKVVQIGVEVLGELEASKVAGEQTMPDVNLFDADSDDEEEKYFPKEEFVYPDGGMRVLEAGMYKPQVWANKNLRETRLLQQAKNDAMEGEACPIGQGCERCGS